MQHTTNYARGTFPAIHHEVLNMKLLIMPTAEETAETNAK